MTQAYPLQWPAGWPRARYREKARFSQPGRSGYAVPVSVATARDRLQHELDMLNAAYPTLSSNVELRLDGQPRSGTAEPSDPGVAVFFRLGGKDMALACDKWDRVADNIVAVAKHIEALRGMDRWGVGTAAQAFAGYEALPAPEQWWQVLGIAPSADRDEITAAYRSSARLAHPDTGGNEAAMARLNSARDQALAALPRRAPA